MRMLLFISIDSGIENARAALLCVYFLHIWRIYTDCAVLTRKCLCRVYTERPIQYIHTRFMLFRLMKYVLWFQVGLIAGHFVCMRLETKCYRWPLGICWVCVYVLHARISTYVAAIDIAREISIFLKSSESVGAGQ